MADHLLLDNCGLSLGKMVTPALIYFSYFLGGFLCDIRKKIQQPSSLTLRLM